MSVEEEAIVGAFPERRFLSAELQVLGGVLALQAVREVAVLTVEERVGLVEHPQHFIVQVEAGVVGHQTGGGLDRVPAAADRLLHVRHVGGEIVDRRLLLLVFTLTRCAHAVHGTVVEEIAQRLRIGVQVDDGGAFDQVDVQVALVAGHLADELAAYGEQQTVRLQRADQCVGDAKAFQVGKLTEIDSCEGRISVVSELQSKRTA